MTLFLAYLRSTLRTSYERDVQRALARPLTSSPVRTADLMRLPPAVQRYLHRAGVIGQPRVRNFRVRSHGRIRSGPTARWMPLHAEQHNFVDEPARLFYLRAAMFGMPIQGYHRFVGSSATMDIRAAGLVTIARAAGPEMDISETVTLFNDMCVMAPATLVEAPIEWEPVDDHLVRARFTNAGHVIHAELAFNDAAELTNFRSDDRYQLSADGRSAKRVRWSTPVHGYRTYGPVRLASGGEGWCEYPYIELAIDDVNYNVAAR